MREEEICKQLSDDGKTMVVLKAFLSFFLYIMITHMQKSVFYLPLTPETNNTKMNKTDAKEEK